MEEIEHQQKEIFNRRNSDIKDFETGKNRGFSKHKFLAPSKIKRAVKESDRFSENRDETVVQSTRKSTHSVKSESFFQDKDFGRNDRFVSEKKVDATDLDEIREDLRKRFDSFAWKHSFRPNIWESLFREVENSVRRLRKLRKDKVDSYELSRKSGDRFGTANNLKETREKYGKVTSFTTESYGGFRVTTVRPDNLSFDNFLKRRSFMVFPSAFTTLPYDFIYTINKKITDKTLGELDEKSKNTRGDIRANLVPVEPTGSEVKNHHETTRNIYRNGAAGKNRLHHHHHRAKPHHYRKGGASHHRNPGTVQHRCRCVGDDCKSEIERIDHEAGGERDVSRYSNCNHNSVGTGKVASSNERFHDYSSKEKYSHGDVSTNDSNILRTRSTEKPISVSTGSYAYSGGKNVGEPSINQHPPSLNVPKQTDSDVSFGWYEPESIRFPDDGDSEERKKKEPCNGGSVRIPLLNIDLPCADSNEDGDHRDRESATSLTDVLHDYLDKVKDREGAEDPRIDVRIGRERRNADIERRKNGTEVASPIQNISYVNNGKIEEGSDSSVFGEIMDVPRNLSKNSSTVYFDVSMLSDYFLEAVRSLDEDSLIHVLKALKEDYLSKSPDDESVVDQVYDKLASSLLQYKRSEGHWPDRRRRESPPKAREGAAAVLELLAETDKLHELEQRDDPFAGEDYAEYDYRNSDDSSENPSFLELVSLADKHKSKVV